MSEEPKPCPFCGHVDGEDGLYLQYYGEPESVFIWCQKCGVSGPKQSTPDMAIAAWNRLAVVPEGWKVVPEKPTEEMGDAGLDVVLQTPVNMVYEAMVAAAPDPQEGTDGC